MRKKYGGAGNRCGGKAKVPRESVVGPTPERAAQRAVLTRGADPTLAESPLGVLVAHRLIDNDHWRIAERYAEAKRIRFGSGQPRSINLTANTGGHDNGDDSGELWAKGILADAEAVFRNRPRQLRDSFDNAVVYKRWPSWFGARELSPARIPELAALIEMLGDLARVFGATPSKAN
jgi:hypothetical protein